MLVTPPLNISNTEDILEVVLDDLSVKEAVAAFLRNTIAVSRLPKSIHVQQSELCCVELEGGPGMVLGSTEATTCVIGVALCPTSSRGSVAHFDESCCASTEQLERWLRGMKEPRIYLAGGYKDSKGTGARIVSTILSFLYLVPDLKARICLACVSHLNTNTDGSPIVSSLAVDTESQTAAWGDFEDKGPKLLQRRAQFWVQDEEKIRELLYDYQTERLTVTGYKATLQLYRRAFFKHLVGLPDKDMINIVSTSPEHETADFIPDLRKVFDWVLQQHTEEIEVPTETFIWVPGRGWEQSL